MEKALWIIQNTIPNPINRLALPGGIRRFISTEKTPQNPTTSALFWGGHCKVSNKAAWRNPSDQRSDLKEIFTNKSTVSSTSYVLVAKGDVTIGSSGPALPEFLTKLRTLREVYPPNRLISYFSSNVYPKEWDSAWLFLHLTNNLNEKLGSWTLSPFS